MHSPRFKLAGGLARLVTALILVPAAFAQVIPTQPTTATNGIPAGSPPEDPLAALMTSQPPIDTTSPVIASAEFDPPVSVVGQSVVYRVTLNALLESVEWREPPPLPGGPPLRPGGRGTYLRMAGSNIVAHASLLYHLTPENTGLITSPAFQVKAYGRTVEVPAAVLRVVDPRIVETSNARRILLELPVPEAVVGQEIPVRLVLPAMANGPVQPLAMVQVNSDDMIVDRAYHAPRVESAGSGGRATAAYVVETAATPIRAGQIELRAQGYVPGPLSTNVNGVAGGYVLVDSEPASLTVLPLADPAGISGFAGGIGRFSLLPPELATNRVRVGEPVTLAVTVQGEGNLERLVPPPPPDAPGWQVFPGTREELPPGKIRERGFTVFRYVLIPLDPASKMTPAIPFGVFDPIARRYSDLTIPGVVLDVLRADSGTGGGLAGGNDSNRGAKAGGRALTRPPLELAALAGQPGRGGDLTPLQQRTGFAWAMMFLMLVFIALAGWERRKSYIEAHPELVVRRSARRAVRLNQKLAARAGAAGDVNRWLAHTVDGFREACAPWLQAEARALTCRDVLGVLAGEEGQEEARRLVQQLFDVAHGTRFGRGSSSVTDAFALRPALDRLLTALRRRL